MTTIILVLILGLAFEMLKTLIPGHPGFVPKLTLIRENDGGGQEGTKPQRTASF